MPAYLVVRRYAPFATFGGGFEGDTRTEATTASTATARTVGAVQFDRTGVLGYSSFSSGSTFEGAGPWLAAKIGRRYAVVKSEVSSVRILPDAVSFTAHTAGANPLVPVVAPDIDTFVDLAVSFMAHGIRYQGTVRGDDFPNAEVFVVEPAGREVLLFDFRTGGGRNTGPMTRLMGKHDKQVLGSFDVLAPPIGPMPLPPARKGK